MAVRKFKLQIDGKEKICFLEKFEWSDIYGDKIQEKRSLEGIILETASISGDGAFIIPKKALSDFYLDEDGKYVSRSEKIEVDKDGKPMVLFESIFKKNIILNDLINLEDYFSYDIITTFKLCSEEDIDDLNQKCLKIFQENKLFKFIYAYFDTYHPQDAILIPFENNIIVAIGTYSVPILYGPTTNVEELFADIDEEEEEEISFEEVW